MKRYFISILIVLGLGTFSWAQGTKELFDARKSQEELEIMKGILSTTLSLVSQNLQRQAAATAATPKATTGYTASSWRVSNINAFYLYGQGAVFIIPSSSFRLSSNFGALGAYSGDIQLSLEAANVELAQLSSKMAQAAVELDKAALESGVRGGVAGGVQGGIAPPASPKAAQTPKPAQPPQPPQSQEEFRKKLTEQVERTRKSREDILVSREKFQKILVEMKGYLMEALANYGDSLTTVKPNEFINVVITTDDFFGGFSVGMAFGNESDVSRREVISVQKSWITDYKAGRLTLDAFRQKALQYRE